MGLEKRIVFIGDSITEWGRYEDSEGIGTGYVRLLHDYLRVTSPKKNWMIFNRGVGGDRIINLEERWQEDVMALKPDIVSISIGINDVWRQLDQPDLPQIFPVTFEEKYRNLLHQVKDKQIILMEPTVIEEKLDSEGNKRLKEYVYIIRKLAKEFQAIVVPTHEVFVAYLEKNKGYALTTDGVHMNSAGNMLIAQTWLKAVNEKISINRI